MNQSTVVGLRSDTNVAVRFTRHMQRFPKLLDLFHMSRQALERWLDEPAVCHTDNSESLCVCAGGRESTAPQCLTKLLPKPVKSR